MSEVNSRLQVRIPKALVEQLGINPGDEIDWEIAGEVLSVIPAAKRRRDKSNASIRLRFFDQATQRQRKRDSMIDPPLIRNARSGPGWTREDLYSRNDNRSAGSRTSEGLTRPQGGKSKAKP